APRPGGGGRSRTQIGERAGLELDDLGLVDFINDGVWWPWQPVRARVEPGGQDDGLTYTRRRGVAEELVEEASAHRHSLGQPSRGECGILFCELDFAVHQPDEGFHPHGVD